MKKQAQRYCIEISDVKTSEDGRFYSFDLFSEGSTLEELINNAVYVGIDQDGGEGPTYEADDLDAEKLIINWCLDHMTLEN